MGEAEELFELKTSTGKRQKWIYTGCA